MSLVTPRRRFLAGLANLIAAPAIIRVAQIMPISVQPAEFSYEVLVDGVWRRHGSIITTDDLVEMTGKPLTEGTYHFRARLYEAPKA